MAVQRARWGEKGREKEPAGGDGGDLPQRKAVFVQWKKKKIIIIILN